MRVRGGPIRLAAALTCGALLAGCARDGTDPAGPSPEELSCDLDLRFLADGGVGRDGIPALSDPTFLPATPTVASIGYLRPDSRIIAVEVGGEWLVIPHQIMYRHEIVNLADVAVTYCPLTGSSLAFERASVGGAELGVSGLLYQANLVLYDRNDPGASLWPQMWGEARCGPRQGQSMAGVPLVEATWEGWLEQHPDSKVLAITIDMFNEAVYLANPYGSNYEASRNGDFLGFPMPELDRRRFPKERVLGIPDADGGSLAFPFLAMAQIGAHAVFEFSHQGEPAIVIWNESHKSAAAYRSVVTDQVTTFTASENGVVDDLTGTVWHTSGTPVSGPLAGSAARLEPIASAYVAFWAAWAAFHPETGLAVGS